MASSSSSNSNSAFTLSEFSQLVSAALELDKFEFDSCLVYPKTFSPSTKTTTTTSGRPLSATPSTSPRVLRKIKSILLRTAPTTPTPTPTKPTAISPIPRISLSDSDSLFVPYLPLAHQHESESGGDPGVISIFSRRGSDGGSSILPPSSCSDSGISAVSSTYFPPTPPHSPIRRISISVSSDSCDSAESDLSLLVDPFAKGRVQVVHPYSSAHPNNCSPTRNRKRHRVKCTPSALPPPTCPLPSLPSTFGAPPSPPLTPKSAEYPDWTLSLPFDVDLPTVAMRRPLVRSKGVIKKKGDLPLQALSPMGHKRKGSPFPLTITLPPQTFQSTSYPSPGSQNTPVSASRTIRLTLPPALPPPTCDLPALPSPASPPSPPSPSTKRINRVSASLRSTETGTSGSDTSVEISRKMIPCKMVRCEKSGLPVPAPASAPASPRGRSGSVFTVQSVQSGESGRSKETEYFSARGSLDV